MSHTVTKGAPLRRRTKTPKPVLIKYTTFNYERSEYTCPSCGVEFVGGGPARSVTRFVCQCGQELIPQR